MAAIESDSSGELMSLDARRTKLQGEIQNQIRAGWTLVHQTDTSATLTRKGQASPLLTLILLLIFILPGILYGMLARPTETMYITVDEYGRGERTIGRNS